MLQLVFHINNYHGNNNIHEFMCVLSSTKKKWSETKCSTVEGWITAWNISIVKKKKKAGNRNNIQKKLEEQSVEIYTNRQRQRQRASRTQVQAPLCPLSVSLISTLHCDLLPIPVNSALYMHPDSQYSGCLSQAIQPDWFNKSRRKLH